MRLNLKEDLRYATIGDGALLVGMAGLIPTPVSSVIPSDMIPPVSLIIIHWAGGC